MRRAADRVPVLAAVLAVLVLVGVVALAATGSRPTGTSESRRPSDSLLDTLFTLGLVALLPAAALFVYGLLQRKAIAEEVASGRYRRTSLAAWLVFVLLFTGVVYFRLRNSDFALWGGGGGEIDVGAETRVPPGDSGAGDPDAYRAEFAWLAVVVVVALAAVGVVAYLAAVRRRGFAPVPDDVAAQLVADALEDGLDDLRREQDPRRAVVAAYARLEQALADSGLPRRPPETAEEYVTRILGRLEVDAEPVRTLTGLYTHAKFSNRTVDGGMKDAAIDALVEIRSELRLLAARRQQAERPTSPEQQAASA